MPTRIYGDYQIHTHYSGRADQRMTPQAIADAAPRLDLKNVGFTDHIYAHTTETDLQGLEQRVRAVDHPFVRAYFGIEAELRDSDHTTVPEGWRDRFDYVVLALDHAKACDYDVPDRDDVDGWLDHYHSGYRLASTGIVDVMAHPFSGCPQALEAIDDSLLTEFLEYLARGKVAIELNGMRLRTVTQPEPFLKLYRKAKAIGLTFATGSDAHRWNERQVIRELKVWVDLLGLETNDLWQPRQLCKIK